MKNDELFGRIYKADVPMGGGYMMSRRIVVNDCSASGIESIVNGMEKEGERMDYIWGRDAADRARMLVDAVIENGIRKFSIIRFRDHLMKELFVMKYQLYGKSMMDAGLMLKGRIN